MQNNKIILIIFLLIITFCMANAEEQKSAKDTTFCYSIELGAGYASEIVSLTNTFQVSNFSPFVRLLWKPNHRLNVGLQAAHINIMDVKKEEAVVEFGSANFRGLLKGTPVIGVFNMDFYGLNLYGGLGVSYVTSTISISKEVVRVYDFYYTYFFGAGLQFYFSRSWGLGVEADAYSFSKLKVFVAGLQVKLLFDFYHF